MSGHYLIEQRLIYKRSIRSRKKGEVKGEEQRCQVYIVRRGVWTPLFNPSPPPSWHPPSFGGPLPPAFTVIQSNFERCISYHNCYVSLVYNNSQLYFVFVFIYWYIRTMISMYMVNNFNMTDGLAEKVKWHKLLSHILLNRWNTFI